jgi:hypothetical protein
MRKKKQFVPIVFTIRNILQRTVNPRALSPRAISAVIARGADVDDVSARPTRRRRESQRDRAHLPRIFP